MDYKEPEWVAERLGLDKNTVYKFLQDGTLPALQLGRKWLISESRLAEWLAQETDRQTDARRTVAVSAERTIRRLDSLADDAREVVRQAHQHSRRLGQPVIDEPVLLLALLDSPVAVVLAGAGVDVDQFRRQVESTLSPAGHQMPRRLGRSPHVRKLMRLADRAARDAGRQVDAPDLFAALLRADSGATAALLADAGCPAARVLKALDSNTGDSQHD